MEDAADCQASHRCISPQETSANDPAAGAATADTGTVEGMGPHYGLAVVRQKERIVATLRPVPSGKVTEISPTLLSQLRPLSNSPAGELSHGIARLEDASPRTRGARREPWSDRPLR